MLTLQQASTPHKAISTFHCSSTATLLQMRTSREQEIFSALSFARMQTLLRLTRDNSALFRCRKVISQECLRLLLTRENISPTRTAHSEEESGSGRTML